MTITIEFPLSGGNKFELFVSDVMTASDFDRMTNVIEIARDSLVITADEAFEQTKADAEADRGRARPVEEEADESMSPARLLQKRMNQVGMERGERANLCIEFGARSVGELTNDQCAELTARMEHRLRERQTTESHQSSGWFPGGNEKEIDDE